MMPWTQLAVWQRVNMTEEMKLDISQLRLYNLTITTKYPIWHQIKDELTVKIVATWSNRLQVFPSRKSRQLKWSAWSSDHKCLSVLWSWCHGAAVHAAEISEFTEFSVELHSESTPARQAAFEKKPCSEFHFEVESSNILTSLFHTLWQQLYVKQTMKQTHTVNRTVLLRAAGVL